MNAVFADAFYLIALSNPSDAHHEAAVRASETLSAGLLTTHYVVVMTNRGLTEALTGDHHFEQAGFRALLRDP